MRDWGCATNIYYDSIPDRSNRRAVAVVRLNMTHLFQSPLQQKIEETDVAVCNCCRETIEMDVWPHLFVECPAVKLIRDKWREAPLFSSAAGFREALFRPAGECDLLCHFRVIGVQICRVMRSIGGETQLQR
jgi:hypothetical protein